MAEKYKTDGKIAVRFIHVCRYLSHIPRKIAGNAESGVPYGAIVTM